MTTKITMMRPAHHLAIPLACLMGSAGGCSPYKPDTDPKPPVSVPETFGGEAAADAAGADAVSLPDRWWESFGDQELNTLIAQALEDNLQLQAAWARLVQAEANTDQARAGRWPQLDGSLQGAYARRNFGPPIGVTENQSYDASLPVSYEVDVWNKFGAGIDAASAFAMASRDDVEATAMTVAAEVTEAWFDVVNANATLALLDTQLKTNETFVELVQLRFGQGLVSAVDVYQQQQQVLTVEAQRVSARARLVLATNRLALLSGRAASGLKLADSTALPEAPPLPGLGVPADLLERRPDLRAARARLVASDHQVAQAVSDRLPALRISGSIGLSANVATDLFQAGSFVNSIAGQLLAPIIDGGRRAAVVRARKAAVTESLANYGQVLLQAVNEVENALAQEEQQVRTLEVLTKQLETAQANLRESRARYTQGLTEYLPVLTALASVQAAERSLLDAGRQRLSSRVQLCRALGGTWTAALNRPAADEAADEDPS